MASLEELQAIHQESTPKQSASLDELIAIHQESGQPEEEQGIFEEFVAPVVAPFSEFAAAANRGALKFAESLTIDPLNSSAQLLGIEGRVPKPSDTEFVQRFTKGDFLGDGLPKKVIRTAGELAGPGAAVGSLSRGVARGLAPAITTAPALQGTKVLGTQAAPVAQTTGQGVAQQLTKGSVPLDVGLSAASGGGSEIGREVGGGETGALVGAFLAPVAATGTTALTKFAVPRIFDAGKNGIKAINGSISGMSEDGAAKLLAETMIREGFSPDEVAKKLAALGPEGLPADLGPEFGRLLRRAANEIPRIQGDAGNILAARTKGQAGRLATAFDDATGTTSLTADDEIIRLNRVLGPQIDEAYAAARAKADQIFNAPKISQGLSFNAKAKPTKLEKALDNKFVAGAKIKNKVELELNAKASSGESVTPLDRVDATKRALDDEIQAALRKGEKNKSRSLVMLKNAILKEVDEAIPEYAQARSLYAGKAALETAVDQGSLFLSNKMTVREIGELTRSMGASEKRFFQLGAKKAVMEKMETIQTKADLTRMFGKGGSTGKLKTLFDDAESFNRFNNTLENESKFIMTRNAAQGGSNTTQQVVDIVKSGDAASKARGLATHEGRANFIGRIIEGLSEKRGTEANTQALEDVGDILIQKGMNIDNIIGLLKKGTPKRIENIVRRAMKVDLSAPRIAPISAGVASEALNEGEQ